MNKFYQKEITLKARSRGYHVVTEEVIQNFPELAEIEKGLFVIFIKHTSASLTINESADSTVRKDFESHFNEMVPEEQSYYKHTTEGPDDMPAHLKASLLGCSHQIPIHNGKLNLGTWQGIYLCEHRNHGEPRKIVITAFGI